jgi:chitinase
MTCTAMRLLERVVLASLALAAVTATASAADGERRVVGYFAGWNAGRYDAGDIPAGKLTHVNYAFGVIRDGEVAVRNEPAALRHFEGLRELKKKHPHLRTLVSVGGWADSGPFSEAALTDASRAKFARSVVAFMAGHGFDGVDIDWEFPGGGGLDKTKARPEDTQNFTALLAELRRQLDEQGKADGKRYLLTIAAPAGGHHQKMELERIHRHLDFINLMTYDFAGTWGPRTAFNAPLYPDPAQKDSRSADASVKAYLDRGVPKERLCLGVPFYGKAFGGVKDVDHGLYQPHMGRPPRVAGSGNDWSYRSIAANHIGKGTTRFWHEQAKVPWLFNPATGVWVTYDDPESLKHKAAYVRQKGLGGVMIWELSQDDGQSSLLNAIDLGLRGGDGVNPAPPPPAAP